MKFIFPQPTPIEGLASRTEPLMRLDDVSFSYPGGLSTVLQGVDFSCSLDSRISLVGPNGSGKSTVVKLLTGELACSSGQVWSHPQMRFAYVAQHAFHHLADHMDKTSVEYIQWRFHGGFDRESVTQAIDEQHGKATTAMAVWVQRGERLYEQKVILERCATHASTMQLQIEATAQWLQQQHPITEATAQ